MKNKISGIYKITNKVNGKIYIGSSTNIIARWKGHFALLKNKEHENNYLQNAFDKYGEYDTEGNKIWLCEVIEECEPTKTILEEIEQRWLNETKCYERDIGYNIIRIAYRPPITSRSGSSHHYWGKKRPEMSGENHPNKRPEIRKILSEQKMGDKNPMKRPEVSQKSRKSKEKYFRPVVRVNKNDPTDIKIYEYIRAVEKDGFDRRNVYKVCKRIGSHKSIAGYYWFYLEEYNKTLNISLPEIICEEDEE